MRRNLTQSFKIVAEEEKKSHKETESEATYPLRALSMIPV